MKKSIYSIAILIVITMAISCKKDNTVSVTGFWAGTVLSSSGGSTPTTISYLYRSNNTMRAYIANTDTTLATALEGTYSIDADSVRTTLTSGANITIFAGKLSNSNTYLKGTYRSVTGTASGTWSVTKQ